MMRVRWFAAVLLFVFAEAVPSVDDGDDDVVAVAAAVETGVMYTMQEGAAVRAQWWAGEMIGSQ